MDEQTTTYPEARNYRVPGHLVAWAEKEAEKRCRETGAPWLWSQIIREALDIFAAAEKNG